MKEFDLKRAGDLAQTVEGDDPLHRIGTYNERSQHRTLKFVIEEDKNYHEVPIGQYVADICRDGNIYEIQTAGFKNLRSKLEYFSANYSVTVVYPAAAVKTVVWVDPSSGELTYGKRIRRKAAKFKLLAELIHIHEFLENKSVRILLFETEVLDYRLLDGRGKDKKIKATKSDVVPIDVISVTEIEGINDLIDFLPFEKQKEYTRADIEKLIQLKGRNLSYAIKTLVMLGILEKYKSEKSRVIYKKRAFE